MPGRCCRGEVWIGLDSTSGPTLPGTWRRVKISDSGNSRTSCARTSSPPRRPVSQSWTRATRIDETVRPVGVACSGRMAPRVLIDLRMVSGRLHGIARYALELGRVLPSLAPDLAFEGLGPPGGLPELGPLAPAFPVHAGAGRLPLPARAAGPRLGARPGSAPRCTTPPRSRCRCSGAGRWWPRCTTRLTWSAAPSSAGSPRSTTDSWCGPRCNGLGRSSPSPSSPGVSSPAGSASRSRGGASSHPVSTRASGHPPPTSARGSAPSSGSRRATCSRWATPSRTRTSRSWRASPPGFRCRWCCSPAPAWARVFPAPTRVLSEVDEADLPALYGSAEALLLPSRHEGFGLPALEAMATGTPVLAASVGALPEVTGGAAELLDPDDPEAWIAASNALVADPLLRVRWAFAGPRARPRLHLGALRPADPRRLPLRAGLTGVHQAHAPDEREAERHAGVERQVVRHTERLVPEPGQPGAERDRIAAPPTPEKRQRPGSPAAGARARDPGARSRPRR